VGGLFLARSHGVEQLGLCRPKSDWTAKYSICCSRILSTRHEARHCYTANIQRRNCGQVSPLPCCGANSVARCRASHHRWRHLEDRRHDLSSLGHRRPGGKADMSRWMAGWQPCRDQAAGTDCRPVNRLPREGPRPLRPDRRYLPSIGRGSGRHHGTGGTGLGVRALQPRLRGRIREGRRRAPRFACARLRAGMGVAGAAADEKQPVAPDLSVRADRNPLARATAACDWCCVDLG
jgi:hypothetical protein